MARREAGARPRLQGQERVLLPPEDAESWAVVETLSHCRPALNGWRTNSRTFYPASLQTPPRASHWLNQTGSQRSNERSALG